MENQVLTIEQMQELIAMDIDISKASCTWCKVRAITPDRKGYSWMILPETLNKFDEEHVPTFTLQDILEILPKYIDNYMLNIVPCCINNPVWMIEYINMDDEIEVLDEPIRENSILEAAFNMLKWCKQNNYI